MIDSLPPVMLSAAQPIWILVIGLVGIVVFGIWGYRRTNPPIPGYLRLILASLRIIGLAGGLLLLTQPVLEMNREELTKPSILLILDNSESMSLKQGGVDRTEQIKRLFDLSEFQKLSTKSQILALGYADSLSDFRIEDLTKEKPYGTSTDLSYALSSGQKIIEPIRAAAIILISDGANNTGSDPIRSAYLSRVPINTIGIGSALPSRDMMITDIAANPVVYQGSKVPFEISYRAIGYDGVTFPISLRGPLGEVVGSTMIIGKGAFTEGRVTFDIPIEASGRLTFRADIPLLQDELTSGNNRRSITISALASKIRVLVMAGPPDFGLGDLVRRLRADPNIEVTTRSYRSGGFLEGSWPDELMLKETDAVILHHFPTEKMPGERVQQFATQIAANDIPLCFVDGGSIDHAKLKYFADRLPVTSKGTVGSIGSGMMIPVRRHAIIAAPDRAEFIEEWGKLPPLQYASGTWLISPQCEVLAEISGSGTIKAPALVISETNGHKAAAILVRDFWRWGMVSPGAEGIVEPMMGRLVRWLAVRKSDKQVQLTFAKDQYNNRELVTFRVACFDESFEPFDGADVSAEISKPGSEPIRTELMGEGAGQYRGGFQSWGEGEYLVKIRALSGNSLIGEDRGTATVEPYSIELLDARMNEPLLRVMAENSGGKYIPADSADALFGSLDYPMERVHKQSRIELWGGWLHLVGVVLALSLEWFIRMRLGML